MRAQVTGSSPVSAYRYTYEFEHMGARTDGLPRDGLSDKFVGTDAVASEGDHVAGQYSGKVHVAKEKFKKGDLFEAVLSQTFNRPCPAPPSDLFWLLRKRNPAPYGFVINLGNAEWLVGASPEMCVWRGPGGVAARDLTW